MLQYQKLSSGFSQKKKTLLRQSTPPLPPHRPPPSHSPLRFFPFPRHRLGHLPHHPKPPLSPLLRAWTVAPSFPIVAGQDPPPPLPPVRTAPLSSSSPSSRGEPSSTGSRRPNPLFHRLREAAGLADAGGQGGGVVEEKEREGDEEEELAAGQTDAGWAISPLPPSPACTASAHRRWIARCDSSPARGGGCCCLRCRGGASLPPRASRSMSAS
jgi:hypothetical protein